MKVQFSQSFDFNQMLVFSVFWHLLILTAVLFLPKPILPENTVVPAFMVSLVSEPTGSKSAAKKRSESTARARKPKAKKKVVEKKTAPKKQAESKKVMVSKPAEVKKVPVVKMPKPNRILEDLNKLEGKKALAIPPGKKMVEELEQLARLEKPKIKPPPAKPIEQKSIAEKTFQELEALKNEKIKDKKAVAPVPFYEDVLEDFAEPKIEESLPEKSKAPEMDLLKELEQLAKLDASPAPVPDLETEILEAVESTKKSDESYDSIIEKFDSFSVESEPVEVKIFSAQPDSSSFQSKLRTLPKASQTTSESGVKDSYVFAKKEGVPGADLRSLYVGLIQEKIYKNWKEPLAEEHNQETIVSFYIFPRGNIDKPFIKRSSGVVALDTLAVRAVLDSVPFPELPKKLKMSNLHVNIYFKYVPKDE